MNPAKRKQSPHAVCSTAFPAHSLLYKEPPAPLGSAAEDGFPCPGLAAVILLPGITRSPQGTCSSPRSPCCPLLWQEMCQCCGSVPRGLHLEPAGPALQPSPRSVCDSILNRLCPNSLSTNFSKLGGICSDLPLLFSGQLSPSGTLGQGESKGDVKIQSSSPRPAPHCIRAREAPDCTSGLKQSGQPRFCLVAVYSEGRQSLNQIKYAHCPFVFQK